MSSTTAPINRYTGKVFSPNHALLCATRAGLPVFKDKAGIEADIAGHKCLLVLAQTGSGKTTQIPQFVLEMTAEGKMVACTQPKRLSTQRV